MDKTRRWLPRVHLASCGDNDQQNPPLHTRLRLKDIRPPTGCFTIYLRHDRTTATTYYFSGSRDAHPGVLRDHSSQSINCSPRQGPASSVSRHRITHEVFACLGTEIAANRIPRCFNIVGAEAQRGSTCMIRVYSFDTNTATTLFISPAHCWPLTLEIISAPR